MRIWEYENMEIRERICFSILSYYSFPVFSYSLTEMIIWEYENDSHIFIFSCFHIAIFSYFIVSYSHSSMRIWTYENIHVLILVCSAALHFWLRSPMASTAASARSGLQMSTLIAMDKSTAKCLCIIYVVAHQSFRLGSTSTQGGVFIRPHIARGSNAHASEASCYPASDLKAGEGESRTHWPVHKASMCGLASASKQLNWTTFVKMVAYVALLGGGKHLDYVQKALKATSTTRAAASPTIRTEEGRAAEVLVLCICGRSVASAAWMLRATAFAKNEKGDVSKLTHNK